MFAILFLEVNLIMTFFVRIHIYNYFCSTGGSDFVSVNADEPRSSRTSLEQDDLFPPKSLKIKCSAVDPIFAMFGSRKNAVGSQHKIKKENFVLQPVLNNVQPIGKVFSFAVSLE